MLLAAPSSKRRVGKAKRADRFPLEQELEMKGLQARPRIASSLCFSQ
jgi:hypothetical protein